MLDIDGSTIYSDNLLCKKGSRGALCSSCENAFIFSSAQRVCVACDESQNRVVAVFGAIAGAAIMCGGLYLSGAFQRLLPWLTRFQVAGVLRQVDSGALRVVWANYQIVQSVSWSLDVSFPVPFTQMLSLLSVFSFDFLSLECIFEDSNHFTQFTFGVWCPLPSHCFSSLSTLPGCGSLAAPSPQLTLLTSYCFLGT
jgi:hypothetical protein